MSANYPSDLTDAQWAVIQPLLPVHTVGRPRTLDMRDVVDAILYVGRSGCQWRMPPKNFPDYRSVNYYFCRWQKDGTWRKVHDNLSRRLRESEGPEHSASIDSQTAKSTGAGGESGFDPAKRVKGRKRHVIVNSLGLILAVLVTSAAVPDAVAARELVGQLGDKYPQLHTLIVDGGYDKYEFPSWVESETNYACEVVTRPPGADGWVRLPRRWVVERTFAWLTRSRRLCRVYERGTASEEAFVWTRMIQLMVKRIAPGPAEPPFKYRSQIAQAT